MAVGEFFAMVQGSIASPAAIGRVSYSGLGFRPKLVLFWGVGAAAAGVAIGRRLARPMFGAAASHLDQRVATALIEDAELPAGSHAACATRSNRCILQLESYIASPMLGAEAALAGMDDDGFTLDWLRLTNVTQHFAYLAIGGSDVTRAAVGHLTAPTTGALPVAQRIVAGLRPRCIILFGCHRVGADVTETRASLSLGASEHTDKAGAPLGRNRAMSIVDGNVSPTAVAQYALTSRVYVGHDAATQAVDAEAYHEVTHPDGFELWWSDLPSSAVTVFYAAIEGGQWRVGHANTPVVSGQGQQLASMFWVGNPAPQGAFFWGPMSPASAVNDTALARMTMGAVTAPGFDTGSGGTVETVDAQTSSAVYMSRSATQPLVHANAGVVTAAASLAWFATDEVQLTWTIAPTVAQRYFYLVGGPRTMRWTLSGTVQTAAGAVIAGARVDAFRASDRAYVGTATSAADGSYSVSVHGDANERYFVRAASVAGNVYGTTEETLVAA